jgi:hypothetical protein
MNLGCVICLVEGYGVMVIGINEGATLTAIVDQGIRNIYSAWIRDDWLESIQCDFCILNLAGQVDQIIDR